MAKAELHVCRAHHSPEVGATEVAFPAAPEESRAKAATTYKQVKPWTWSQCHAAVPPSGPGLQPALEAREEGEDLRASTVSSSVQAGEEIQEKPIMFRAPLSMSPSREGKLMFAG